MCALLLLLLTSQSLVPHAGLAPYARDVHTRRGLKPRMQAQSAGAATAAATFGMGCFWAPQAAFKELDGVVSSTAGYAAASGLASSGPGSYFSVCRGDGRTEAVRVEYDPRVVSYGRLLQVFWQEHDASVVVPGKEDQYRSVIWAHNEAQQLAAEKTIAEAVRQYADSGREAPGTVVVRADADASTSGAVAFAKAETYHQNFWLKARAKLYGVGLLQLILVVAGGQDPESAVVRVAALGQQAILLWWFVENVELVFSAARGLLAKP